MTVEEMTQITLNHWKSYYPKEYRKTPKDYLKKQAAACANLTRTEMDCQKMVYPWMSDEDAWAEARGIFCLTKIPEWSREED